MAADIRNAITGLQIWVYPEMKFFIRGRGACKNKKGRILDTCEHLYFSQQQRERRKGHLWTDWSVFLNPFAAPFYLALPYLVHIKVIDILRK